MKEQLEAVKKGITSSGWARLITLKIKSLAHSFSTFFLPSMVSFLFPSPLGNGPEGGLIWITAEGPCRDGQELLPLGQGSLALSTASARWRVTLGSFWASALGWGRGKGSCSALSVVGLMRKRKWLCSPRSALVVPFLRHANNGACPRFCSVRCCCSGQGFKEDQVSALTGGSQDFSSAVVSDSVMFLEWDEIKTSRIIEFLERPLSSQFSE